MFRKDKHTKVFLAEILGIVCVTLITGVMLMELQENRLRGLLLGHDAAIASSLLEQGVGEQTVAEALFHTETLPAGENLLRRLGLSEETVCNVIPSVSQFFAAERTVVSLCGVLFFLLLFLSVCRYLGKKEKIYKNAIAVIENYTENDFSLRLPELYEGTLFQLFARINFMAEMLKTKQEAENKAKEFLKTMISDISHQLKTPLTALAMYQEIILNEPDQEETVTVFIKKSGAALARIEGLIQNLLKIARLDAGNVTFHKKYFTAPEIISEALEGLEDRAVREKKALVITGDENAEAYCDIEWSREALGNIVKNALDHTKAGDRITVTWDQSPLMTRFTVTDTGEGIAEEDIHHIFKRFYRSNHSCDRQGTGLGLALAKAVLDGHGGTVSVRSEAGRGAEFVLSFPWE